LDTAASFGRWSSVRALGAARSSLTALIGRNFATSLGLALTALLCGGCDTSPDRGHYPVERAGERRIQYACRDGEQVEMRIVEGRGIAYLTRAGRTIQLKEQSSESGFIYSDGANTVRRKGRDLRLDIAGRERVECRSQSE
jgi:membrane-bound inhibitor of C-type lysozyme